jgi:thioredoxin-related protein
MQLHQKYSDQGLEVIIVNVEGEEGLEPSKELAKKLGLSCTNVVLAEGMSEEGLAAIQMTEEAGLPSIHFFDKKGRLRQRLEGFIDHDEVERLVGELLSEE